MEEKRKKEKDAMSHFVHGLHLDLASKHFVLGQGSIVEHDGHDQPHKQEVILPYILQGQLCASPVEEA